MTKKAHQLVVFANHGDSMENLKNTIVFIIGMK